MPDRSVQPPTLDLSGKKGEFVILDQEQFSKTLDGLLSQIIDSAPAKDEVAFIGIRSRGDILAKRLALAFEERTSRRVLIGTLDINFYRDDFAAVGLQPEIRDSRIDFSIDGKTVFLVDDVLFTGRTVRAALICFADLGRTRCIRLVELIDRGLRELPIQADFLGLSVVTTRDQWVQVMVKEMDGEDKAVLLPYDSGTARSSNLSSDQRAR